QERQWLAALCPVLQEVVGKHAVALRPQPAGRRMGRAFAFLKGARGGGEHLLVARGKEAQGLQRLGAAVPVLESAARLDRECSQQPLGGEAPVQVEALGWLGKDGILAEQLLLLAAWRVLRELGDEQGGDEIVLPVVGAA